MFFHFDFVVCPYFIHVKSLISDGSGNISLYSDLLTF